MGFSKTFCLGRVSHPGTLIGFWDADISVGLECCSIIYISFRGIFDSQISRDFGMSFVSPTSYRQYEGMMTPSRTFETRKEVTLPHFEAYLA